MINYIVQGYMQMKPKDTDVCKNNKYENQESGAFEGERQACD